MNTERFKGSLETQQVEMTLEKFIEVLNENFELKAQLDDVNPWMRWVHFAHMIDSFRLFPRIVFGVYILLMGSSGFWFMSLVAPTVAQAGFISTIVGAGAAWFGLYVNSGWKHSNKG
jgi:hypothetical protein